MAELPQDDGLDETRAALAPTLEATAAILPWVSKPRVLRFDKKLNARWEAACKRLQAAWSDRYGSGQTDLRPAIFTLYRIALETGDADCLELGEALASAADFLDESLPPQLAAALSACLECLGEDGGLEHVLFAERARHFAHRLTTACSTTGPRRSAVIDRLFVDEALERLDRMQEALIALPPDAYALNTEASELAQQAETLDLWGIVHLARQLRQSIPAKEHIDDLDQTAVRDQLAHLIRQIELAISTIDT